MKLTALAIFALTAGPACAGTIVHTVNGPSTLLPATVHAPVPKFNPAQGQLETITLHVQVNLGGTFGVENTTATPTEQASGNPYVDGTVSAPGLGAQLAPWLMQYGIPPLAAFDGALDYGGTSGGTFTVSSAYGGGAHVIATDSAIARDAFTGSAGTVTVVIDAAAHTTFNFPATSEALTGTATITVVYEYSSYPSRFCFATSGTWCPCGGTAGCANSQNQAGADLTAAGSSALGAETLELTASGLPPSAIALLFQGTSSSFNGTTFGDGRRCLSGAITRMGVKSASGGVARWPGPAGMPLATAGMVPPAGGLRAYQVWYRDPHPFCSAATFNLSSALTVQWTP